MCCVIVGVERTSQLNNSPVKNMFNNIIQLLYSMIHHCNLQQGVIRYLL